MNPDLKKGASTEHYPRNPHPQNKKSKERYQQNPGRQKQNSLNRYYKNRDAILSVKDRFQLSDNEMDKLNVALIKENKRRLKKDYYEPVYYSPEIVDDLLPSSMKGVDLENTSYDSSPIAIPVDTNGTCYVAGVVNVSCIDE
uniref:Uncharacterized protein n=1 Tax=Amphimedon queenslandica TaxID=400682 RepID=A0A1X7UCP8_AMPQE